MPQLGAKKSRFGCTQCKKRRVKCDEHVPCCSNCGRRSEQCSLGAPTPSTLSHASPAPASISDDWLQDLALMHHYTGKTARSDLGSGPAMRHLWQENIPLEAIKHRFLMHGILALSALHLAATTPTKSKSYLQISDKHHVTAVSSFRDQLSGPVTSASSNALFGLSMVLSISSLARAALKAAEMTEPQYMVLDDIVELLYMTRGVRDVVDATYDMVCKGPFSVALHGHQPVSPGRETLPLRLSECFATLLEVCNDPSNPSRSDLCIDACKDLRAIYVTIMRLHGTEALQSGHIFWWVALRSYDYLKLVESRYPPALVITAYFFVSTGILAESWFLRGFSRLGFDGIAQCLDTAYSKHLVCARELIVSDMAMLKAET